MFRNYWVYQARGTPEPFAAHVIVSNLGGLMQIQTVFYAEWIATEYNQETRRCAGDYDSLLACFKSFLEGHEQEFTLDEVKQVNEVWLKIAKDFGI